MTQSLSMVAARLIDAVSMICHLNKELIFAAASFREIRPRYPVPSIYSSARFAIDLSRPRMNK